ncbi:TAF5-like RNA polymerase II p300/CBP-associated factor-associated factor 65 kDa subunit 5L [Dendronephthya gigantea]|uniref:TAF5-like RNA polymerase II p300/CBP-associated factor-associated factor 65 kDa subunit 5L n=1 Tax=Dendronephthya gigantea TaxID=151771 RepID=UPI001069625E|nr:TAF5-like RNA polymerase II p300/CBP-associated factor-associated factor 65 kDa subunit 5L [Dendronephthya gigantea]
MSQNQEDTDIKDSSESAALSNFFKIRKYSGVDLVQSTQDSIMDVLVKQTIESESGQSNVLSFSTTTKDATVYFQQLEEQFIALKTFIAGTNSAYRQELIGMKYPIFVNIYLELVEKSQDKKSVPFYNQHVGDFLTDHKEELQHLRGITGPEKLSTSDIAANFRKSKYVHRLSHKVFIYLLQFLSGLNRSILLHFIDKNIHLEVNNVRTSLLESYTEDVGREKTKVGVKKTDLTVPTELLDAIKAMKDEPPNLPTVVLHNITNCTQGVTSAVISNDGQLMCAGFEDSAVRLWSLTPKKLVVNQENFREMSQVNLGIGVTDDDDDNSKASISSETLTLRAHTGPVYSVCFSQDNSFMLSASEDTTVRLWTMNSYTNRVSYIGHNYPVWHVDLSNLDVYFVSTSMDQTARLWNLEYNYPLRIFAGHTASVDTAKFHPNCTYIATASSDQTCRLWDVHSGSFVRLFSGHKGAIFSLMFSSDGKHLLGAGEDRVIHVWDISTGKRVRELTSHSHTLYSLAVNSCNLLASGGGDAKVLFWDLNQVLKTSQPQGSTTWSKPMHSYTAKCTNILNCRYGNDNLVYAVSN